MLWTIVILLILLLALGLLTSYAVGGVIRVFLAIAAIATLVRIIRGPGSA